MTRTWPMWVGAAILLGGAGCSSQVRHTLVGTEVLDLPPNSIGCGEVGLVIPSGASIQYDIGDNYGDDMDVSIVPDDGNCDPTGGAAFFGSTNWSGEVSRSTGSLPGGSYALGIACYNVVSDCTPTLYSITYED